MTAIGPTCVVAPRSAVHAVELDGEAVLLHPEDLTLHRLNASATLVWSRLDGRCSLQAVAAEIAAAAGLPVEAVLADVVPLVGQMVEVGLVEVTAAEAAPDPPAAR